MKFFECPFCLQGKEEMSIKRTDAINAHVFDSLFLRDVTSNKEASAAEHQQLSREAMINHLHSSLRNSRIFDFGYSSLVILGYKNSYARIDRQRHTDRRTEELDKTEQMLGKRQVDRRLKYRRAL